jgi:hypothetical protein
MTALDLFSTVVLGGGFGFAGAQVGIEMAKRGHNKVLAVLVPLSALGATVSGVVTHLQPVAFGLLLGYVAVALRWASLTAPPFRQVTMLAHFRAEPLPVPIEWRDTDVSHVACAECGQECWLPRRVVESATLSGFGVRFECPAHHHLPL